jgi:hypothetical protein
MQDRTPDTAARLQALRPEEAAPRPDQTGPRGNPQVDAIDVERGLDKLERVSGN